MSRKEEKKNVKPLYCDGSADADMDPGAYATYGIEEPESILSLAPHRAMPRILSLKDMGWEIPSIEFSLRAYSDTQCVIEEAGADEIAWLGTVQKISDSRYLIGKIFLFEQTVSAGDCELDAGVVGKFYTDVLKKNPANKQLLNSILFWGHLHPGGMVEPSLQDDEQMNIFSHNPYFIRGIFTRQGKAEFTFFDYARNLKICDCPWRVRMGSQGRRRQIAKEIKEKVKSKPVKYNAGHYNYYNWRGHLDNEEER